MKRLQIYIEEDADDALAAEAARRGTSKAAVVREAVGAYLEASEDPWEPLRDLVGVVDSDPSETVDEVVYD